jgi:putative nucleotidyltransferase with HDIG domain
VVGLVETHSSLSDLFASLASFSDQLLVHSVSVSALSVMLAIRMGYEKKTTLEKVALGGLLHDIGLKALPPELLKKSAAQMTNEELRLYETHSFKGQQMLMGVGVVPEDVVSIVYEHHENAIGQGYPQQIRDVKMHPLAKVVGLADAFSDLILVNANCPTPKNPREAIVYLEHTLGVPYNREAFRALKRIVNGEVELRYAA